MAFDKDLIDAVLKHADIVKVVSSYLTVTKKGRNFVAVCPFHDDTDPSLTISPEKQIFKCFVCGTSGNAISFVSKYEHLSYQDAVRKVAELCDFHDPRLEKNVYVKKIDPELALERANKKFTKRFNKLEELTNKPLGDLTFEEYDSLWQEAKRLTKEY